MNEEVKMSADFLEANREAIDEALFNQIVNPPDVEARMSAGDGLSALGDGLAWAAFWIAAAIVLSVWIWKPI